MHSDAGDTTQLVPGYPIRTPWDHSLVDSSPRPIAASHVLHRLLVPRHPPLALTNLTTKMLASTIQFSTNNPTHPKPQHKRPHKTPYAMTDRPEPHNRGTTREDQPHQGRLVPSGPNRMLTTTTPEQPPSPSTPHTPQTKRGQYKTKTATRNSD
jgi:hypothetical protein